MTPINPTLIRRPLRDVFLLVLLLLPDGRLRRRRTRPLFLVGLTMWVVLGMSIAFEPRLGGLSDTPTSIDNPVAIPMLSGALDIGGKLAKLALAMVFIVEAWREWCG